VKPQTDDYVPEGNEGQEVIPNILHDGNEIILRSQSRAGLLTDAWWSGRGMVGEPDSTSLGGIGVSTKWGGGTTGITRLGAVSSGVVLAVGAKSHAAIPQHMDPTVSRDVC
jgi:hypothetical protein